MKKLGNFNLPSDAVVTGWWDGEPIWHHKTAEERLHEVGISEEMADFAMTILGNRETSNLPLLIEKL